MANPTSSNPPHYPWKLPVLVPLWILQLLVAFVFLLFTPIIANMESNEHPGLNQRCWMIVIVFICHTLLVLTEIYLFTKQKLSTRLYILSQWVKATLLGAVWLILEVVEYLGDKRYVLVWYFVISMFIYHHPSIVAALYYASRAYTKYGGDAGGPGTVEDEEAAAGDEIPHETTPLLRDGEHNA